MEKVFLKSSPLQKITNFTVSTLTGVKMLFMSPFELRFGPYGTTKNERTGK